ncbi:MAG: AAA family ATPase [Clostridium sp.]|nr:AAA family ATPase [Clostridium sp.]
MRILDVYISGFGKFHNTDIAFQDGLNIVYGKNEAGKSTIHTFIRSMLFGLERQRGRAARNDIYSKYAPWENSNTYEGQLRLESGETIYRIERSFLKNRKEFTIINETTGKEETDAKAVIDEILGGISETTYNNTISISQLKSATDEGMISELKNYIANMNTSGNMALNITKASSYLKNQKKKLEAQLSPETAQNYTSLLTEIRSLEQELASPEYENQMSQYIRLRENVKQEIVISQQEKDELTDKLARGQKMLYDFDFTDETSIRNYLDKTEGIYQDYKESSRIVSENSGRTLPVFLFLLGVLCSIGTAWSLGWYLNPHNTFLPVFPIDMQPKQGILWFGAGAVLAFLTATGFLLYRKRHEKTARLCSATLSEIFRRHLGDNSISDEAMDALRGRLEEFIHLRQTMDRSEETLRQQAEKISSLLEKQNSCSEVIEQQQRIQWELEKKLEHLAACKDRATALKHIIHDNERIRQDIDAIDLAQETMQELSMSIRDSFGLYLNKTASELINGITGGRYSSISIDENLKAFLNTKRKLIPLEQVSSGTADQIYLALRLAAAKFIQSNEDRLPLIFDDSFALYDDERLMTALKWLPGAYQGQIIIFTCHKREERILREAGVEHHFIEI